MSEACLWVVTIAAALGLVVVGWMGPVPKSQRRDQ